MRRTLATVVTLALAASSAQAGVVQASGHKSNPQCDPSNNWVRDPDGSLDCEERYADATGEQACERQLDYYQQSCLDQFRDWSYASGYDWEYAFYCPSLAPGVCPNIDLQN
jgi:hypothetical protein